MTAIKESPENQHSLPLLPFFFLLIGLGTATLAILPYSLANRVLNLFEISQTARSALETSLIGTLIPAISLVSFGFILTAGVLFLFRHKEQELTQKLVNRIVPTEESFFRDNESIFGMPRSKLWIWLLICSAFILVQYWPTLVHGFFRYDDFRLLNFVRTHTLWENIFVPPHDDHTYALFRLWLAAMVALFGVSAVPHNIALLTIFTLMVFFAVLIMREMQVGPLSILIAVTLLTGLSSWGETIAGYYTQTIHPLIVLLCLVSIWAYVRWKKTAKAVLPTLTAGAMIMATFIDIAGSWVPLAVLTFALCHNFAMNQTANVRSFLRTDFWVVATTLGILLFALAFNLYVFKMIAPGSFLMLVEDAMPPGTTHSVANFCQQLFYIVTAGLLLPIFPIGYWKVPALVLVPALTILMLAAVTGLLFVWQKMARPRRWFTVFALLLMLGTSLMVVLARGYAGFGHAWPSKYIGTPYLWFCILLALVYDTLWKRAGISTRLIFLKMTPLMLGLFLCVQAVFDIATSRIDSKPPGNGSGYRSNINDAKLRKTTLDELRNDFIVALLSQSTHNPVSLPTLDAHYINHIYPSHDTSNNLSYYREFIVPSEKNVIFLRNSAMRRAANAKDVQIVTSLRTATDATFIKALENEPYVQGLYLSSVPLDFRRRDCQEERLTWTPPANQLTRPHPARVDDNGRLVLKSEGEATFAIREGQWDPETAHELRIGIQGFSYDGEPVRLELNFSGELKIPYPNPWLELTSHQVHCISVDLLQVYAYALNPRVKDLALRFRTPGIYKISQVALQSD